MILPIYVYGQPVLRKVAEDITPEYPNLKELIANMFETMVHADGVGLAAPQIGLPIRVVTITLDPLSEDYPEFKDFNKAYINPHIIEVGGEEVSMEEGCLSLPGIHESVKRGNKIRVKYMDENLVEHDEVVEDVTIPMHPVIEEIKQEMKECGALNAMMSGSGPTVFGLFENRTAAREAQRRIREKSLAGQVYVTSIHGVRRN